MGSRAQTPIAIVTTDLDGDGKVDVATSNFSGNSVTLLRNTSAAVGTVTFATKVNFLVAMGSGAIVARDLDGDGKKDLAVTNYYSRTISILRNKSNAGAFSIDPRQEFGVGPDPTGIAVADFDADGKADLVSSNGADSAVSILKNRSFPGSLAFDGRPEFGMDAAAVSLYGVAVSDFDGDGRQDVVTANNFTNNISVLRNASTRQGSIKFSQAVHFAGAASSGPSGVAVSDFDGDGRADVVVANSALNTVSVFRNTSTGIGSIAFGTHQEFGVGTHPGALAAGDFDGDGRVDLAVINPDSANVSILRNTSSSSGTVSFATGVDLGVNSNPAFIVIADMNGDDKPDLAVTNSGSTLISAIRNTNTTVGALSFATKVDFEANSSPYSITADDFDGDGKPDLAVTDRIDPNGFVSIFRNISVSGGAIDLAPKVDFTVTSNPILSSVPQSVVNGDFDGDGRADIILRNAAHQRVSSLRNISSGPGNINFAPRVDTVSSEPNSAMAVGDFDRDGKQDVVYTTYNANSVGFLQNPCTVSAEHRFDFDGDGKTDLAIFRPGPGEWWYLKSSTGGNAAAQFGAGTDKITPGDFTGDGKTDIAFWRPSTGFWYVLRSEDFSFYSFPFGASTDIPAPADYDADGKTDAAVFRPSETTWYISRSTGGTTIQQFGIAGDVPVSADYDGDGRSDVAIYRPSAGEWWIQRSSAGLIAFAFGNSNDRTVPGDYTGDGKADVGIWRPSTGEWFILRSENQSYYSFPFGTSGDVPSPGDYDGDGKTDAGIFRTSSSTWFINRSGGGTLIQQFGQAGDISVPSAFVR